jgi:thioester reductase-like protein
MNVRGGETMTKLSIQKAYRGRTVLLTGATGFVAKVWMMMALDRVESIDRVYVLIRRRGEKGAQARLEEIFETSPAARPLHERWGERLGEVLSGRVVAVDGDVSLPRMGLSDDMRAKLLREVNLVVHCAGLVDFDPDVRESISSNIDGALEVADFVQACADASLVHVSTCYVAGLRNGRIEERVHRTQTPNGTELDPEKEFTNVKAQVERVLAREQTPDARQRREEEVRRRAEALGVSRENEATWEELRRTVERRSLRDVMAQEGTRRAARFGWPNTYTWSKAIAERLLVTRYPNLRKTIVRPAIVESALEFPFPGWNEGFNTCGPFCYLSGTWMKHIPARSDNTFDVIPVDWVCRSMFIAGAALLEGHDAPEVISAGSSDQNPLTMGRATELTGLYHRRKKRTEGRTLVERQIASRWELTNREHDHIFAPAHLRSAVRGLAKGLGGMKKTAVVGSLAAKASRELEKADRPLSKLERVCDVFKPFTHDLNQVFESQALGAFEVEEALFVYDPHAWTWRSYWNDVHMPGLETWSFPVLLKKEIEKLQVPYRVRLSPPVPDESAAYQSGVA